MTAETAILPDLVAGPRLLLRAWQPADVDVLAEAVARNIEHLRPWMAWAEDEPLTREARRALIDGWGRGRRHGGDVVYGAFRDGGVLGGGGLHRRRGPHGLEIGYWVDVSHTGRGFATEIAGLLTSVALAQPGITFVEIHHDRANIASGRVPAKLGYTYVGEAPAVVNAPGQVGIDCTWRVEADEWRGGH